MKVIHRASLGAICTLWIVSLLGCANEGALCAPQWERIKAGASPQASGATAAQDMQRMVATSRAGRQPFWELCQAADAKKRIACYVGRFGREGAEADYAWMLADPAALLPTTHVYWVVHPPKPKPGPEYDMVEGFEQVNRMVCKAEVQRFLREPAVFRRYYQAVMWSGMLLGSPEDQNSWFQYAAGELDRDFPAASAKDYWCYARQFMVLAHATGRDDLLMGVAATDLRRRCSVWYAWLAGKGGDAGDPSEDAAILHMKPDEQHFVWHFDLTWTLRGEHILTPLTLPDRPFPDCKLPVLGGTSLSSWATAYYPSDPSVRAAARAIGAR